MFRALPRADSRAIQYLCGSADQKRQRPHAKNKTVNIRSYEMLNGSQRPAAGIQ